MDNRPEEEIESRRVEMAPVEQPKPRFVMFRIGQTIQIDGVTFRVRKVTPKDIVLRPLRKGALCSTANRANE